MSETEGNVTAQRLSIGRPLHMPETPDTTGAYLYPVDQVTR
jgi:hypothetical protein